MNPEPTNMYNPTGFDFKSIGFCSIAVLLSNVPAAPAWLSSLTQALASVAAISTITYNAIKMWLEIMGKQKTKAKPHPRKPLKK